MKKKLKKALWLLNIPLVWIVLFLTGFSFYSGFSFAIMRRTNIVFSPGQGGVIFDYSAVFFELSMGGLRAGWSPPFPNGGPQYNGYAALPWETRLNPVFNPSYPYGSRSLASEIKFLGFQLLWLPDKKWYPLYSATIPFVAFVVPWFAWTVVSVVKHWRAYVREVRIRDRLCPFCEYDMNGLEEEGNGRCPECGELPTAVKK